MVAVWTGPSVISCHARYVPSYVYHRKYRCDSYGMIRRRQAYLRPGRHNYKEQLNMLYVSRALGVMKVWGIDEDKTCRMSRTQVSIEGSWLSCQQYENSSRNS